MKIAVVSAEVWPLSKTGGLADYVHSLSGALSEGGNFVDVFTPDYSSSSGEGKDGVYVNGTELSFSTERMGGWNVVKVGCQDLFSRENMYGYNDDYRRFAYFSKAVASFIAGKGYDIAHCNDWQTGYIPLLLKKMEPHTPSLFTIHNMEFQGNSTPEILDEIGIDRSYYQMEGVEYYGNASAMKAGIVYCDSLVTVSPTYSREIQTAEYGFGMEGIIKKHSSKLAGVLNGIDYRVWDPSADRELRSHYSIASQGGKALCKSSLQREFSLPQVGRPLIAFIGRLWKQKGADLLLDALPLVRGAYQLIILGTGDEELMKRMQDMASGNPAYRAIMRFDEPLSHRIYAGSDIFVMPSRFEPCGLGQMISMRYGTVPVVRRTGGLADTVSQFDPSSGEGEGFVFENSDTQALARALSDAIRLYSGSGWSKAVSNCMQKDFSWENSAREYARLYSAAAASKSTQ